MTTYDAIVLGTGGVGSATCQHLARRGVRVLGLDRFEAGHDRGSSHGQTRIIRKAYFEHPGYVPLLELAYASWRELEELRGLTGEEERLFRRVGLLQVGPPEGRVVRGVLESARQHGLDVERLAPAEVAGRFPGLCVPGDLVGVFEADAGYLRVEACVRAHLEEAARQGAELRSGVVAESWRVSGAGVEVRTDQGVFAAGRLVITAGPWAGSVLGPAGPRLEVRRKPTFWFADHEAELRAAAGCPCFLYELPQGVFYGVPAVDAKGVKVARHSGGAVVDDPTNLDRGLDPAEADEVERFAAEFLPGVRTPFTGHAVCMYTMSADERFVVDRHPESEGVVFAAGLSGHGFKFAGVLGEALADLATEGSTPLPIEFLAARRPVPGSPEP